ncbi:uncharacterized protein J3D65DRAFT_638805 [Phyllosticta citribraziliensis]|uniref:Secreted protein n=1 Tax=Phyllosticta citribraziliensis TaxID=989973 RepID=A0ABR1L5Q5_9PEZI
MLMSFPRLLRKTAVTSLLFSSLPFAFSSRFRAPSSPRFPRPVRPSSVACRPPPTPSGWLAGRSVKRPPPRRPLWTSLINAACLPSSVEPSNCLLGCPCYSPHRYIHRRCCCCCCCCFSLCMFEG